MKILSIVAFLSLQSSCHGLGIRKESCFHKPVKCSPFPFHLKSSNQESSYEQECNSSGVKVRKCNYILEPDNDSNTMYQRRRFLPGRKKLRYAPGDKIEFNYEYNELVIPPSLSNANICKTRIILFIQPIGVGIGRWYYDRLLEVFQTPEFQNNEWKNIYLVPDLLGCGSASLISSNGSKAELNRLPLLNVIDWSGQIMDLMSKYEKQMSVSDADQLEWCLVSNGGCVPIALEVARKYIENTSMVKANLTNLILSATPRIGSLLKPQDNGKIQKSFRTLSGTAGNLFWWYSLRNDGAFIQKFSEKNLASRAENLGEQWRPKCVETAKSFNGLSKFSTFAFLAGSLNGGNQERFDALKGVDWIKIDVITGGDKRSNAAKSWFWTKDKKTAVVNKKDEILEHTTEVTSLVPFLKENGNSGREIVVKGRRCPAHEDAKGFATAISKLLHS